MVLYHHTPRIDLPKSSSRFIAVYSNRSSGRWNMNQTNQMFVKSHQEERLRLSSHLFCFPPPIEEGGFSSDPPQSGRRDPEIHRKGDSLTQRTSGLDSTSFQLSVRRYNDRGRQAQLFRLKFLPTRWGHVKRNTCIRLRVPSSHHHEARFVLTHKSSSPPVHWRCFRSHRLPFDNSSY